MNAIKQAFEEKGNQACGGKWKIEYEARDDASAALGKWDPDVATANVFYRDTSIIVESLLLRDASIEKVISFKSSGFRTVKMVYAPPARPAANHCL